MEKCREAFEQFDMDKSGTIEPWELKVRIRLALRINIRTCIHAHARTHTHTQLHANRHV